MNQRSLRTVPLPDGDVCLFLDFDGTLVDFAATPDGVPRDDSLVRLLETVQQALDGALALISGRAVDTLDTFLAPLRLPVAGLHGYERRAADGAVFRPPEMPAHLERLRAELQQYVATRPGLLLEDKRSSLAVHFRRAPHHRDSVRAMFERFSAGMSPDLELLEGDAVVEVKPASHNKATAIEAFMREPPFAGRLPIFIGDDVTDRDGFEAVQRYGGMAIAVGDRVTAPWRLPDPGAVRNWVRELARERCTLS